MMIEIIGKINQNMTTCSKCKAFLKFDESDMKQKKEAMFLSGIMHKGHVEVTDYIICPRCKNIIPIKASFKVEKMK